MHWKYFWTIHAACRALCGGLAFSLSCDPTTSWLPSTLSRRPRNQTELCPRQKLRRQPRLNLHSFAEWTGKTPGKMAAPRVRLKHLQVETQTHRSHNILQDLTDASYWESQDISLIRQDFQKLRDKSHDGGDSARPSGRRHPALTKGIWPYAASD